MKTNALGITVTKPDSVLVIMRGPAGSGKSTLAKKLVGEGVIHSTDDVISSKGDYFEFFKNMEESKNYGPLFRAHMENTKNAMKSMDSGITPVVIDNTNIKANECKKLVEYALSIGYADDNIKFAEVDISNITAEILAERNSHGVPLEKCDAMLKGIKSVGPLTLEKVLKSKDFSKPKKLAMVVLDDHSRNRLLTALVHKVPKDWEVIAHHMTINFGKGLGEEREGDLGKTVSLIANEIGISDKAIAVKVEGYPSDNATPHITLAIDRKNGAAPKDSNEIQSWVKLDSYINLKGTIVEQKLG